MVFLSRIAPPRVFHVERVSGWELSALFAASTESIFWCRPALEPFTSLNKISRSSRIKFGGKFHYQRAKENLLWGTEKMLLRALSLSISLSIFFPSLMGSASMLYPDIHSVFVVEEPKALSHKYSKCCRERIVFRLMLDGETFFGIFNVLLCSLDGEKLLMRTSWGGKIANN